MRSGNFEGGGDLGEAHDSLQTLPRAVQKWLTEPIEMPFADKTKLAPFLWLTLYVSVCTISKIQYQNLKRSRKM